MGVTIYGAHDQVVIEATHVVGEPTATEGIVMTVNCNYDSYIFWETIYRPGESPRMETIETIYGIQQPSVLEYTYSGVTMDFGITNGSTTSSLGIQMSQAETGLDRAYWELYQETANGEDGMATIALKDYMDTYPMTVEISLPDIWWYSDDEWLWDTMESSVYLSYERACMNQLLSYFVFPVGDAEMELYLSKNIDGTVYSMGANSVGEEVHDLWTTSAIDEDICYFALQSNQVLDTRQMTIPYGVYGMPYGSIELIEEESVFSVVVPTNKEDVLEVVYPLNPEDTVFHLELHQDGAELWIHQSIDGVYTITVLDTANYQVLQQFTMPYPVGSRAEVSCYTYEEAIVIEGIDTAYQSWVSVVERGADGLYQVHFTCEAGEDPYSYYYDEVDVLFDGQRLVMARAGNNHSSSVYSLVRLWVYTADGLQYQGNYSTSLQNPNGGYGWQYVCQLTENQGLTLSWAT